MDETTTLLYGIIFIYVFSWINYWHSGSQKLKRRTKAVDAWLETLKAGGSKNPVELAKVAGVDITTNAPLKSTIAYISELVDEVETLTNEIEHN